MRVLSNEQVLPKKKTPYLPYGIWKVTARYNVQIGSNKFISCIRVRGPIMPTGNAVVLHFSELEFYKLFKKVVRKEK